MNIYICIYLVAISKIQNKQNNKLPLLVIKIQVDIEDIILLISIRHFRSKKKKIIVLVLNLMINKAFGASRI